MSPPHRAPASRLAVATTIASLVSMGACGTDPTPNTDPSTTGAAAESSTTAAASSVPAESTAGVGDTTSADVPDDTTADTATDLPIDACLEQRAALEFEIAAAFDLAAVDPTITADPDATLLVADLDGATFVHSHGDSSPTTIYESASTSKWVTAAIILDRVDRGELGLDTTTSELLDFWPPPGVPLRTLLSFTSGFDDEAPCINSPFADFAACVEEIYAAGAPDATAPGEAFHYSGSHLQIAGLMAMRAAGVDDWSALFTQWQADTGLFPTGAYDLPSASNPRLAGGMHWTGEEYLAFLQALGTGAILTDDIRAAMLANQRGDAIVEASPSILSWGEDWAYGFGNWLECSTATAEPGSYDCGDGERNSSAGAYGAYPMLDAEHGLVAVVARQGGLASGAEGVALYRAVAEQVEAWAALDCPG
jgi:CubicO group peptidase (beta-lactamase class C family)